MIMALDWITVIEFLLGALEIILLTIVGVVIAQMVIDLHHRPKTDIKTQHDGARFGFGIWVKKGMIKDVMVEVNGKEYQREAIDQKTRTFKTDDAKNLYANRQPTYVFPFLLDAIYIKDIREVPLNIRVLLVDKQEKQLDGILVVIKEILTNEVVYCECMQIPSGNFETFWGASYSKKNLYNAKILITGEGLETANKYVLHLGLAEFIVQDIPKIRAGTSRPISEYVVLEFEHKGLFYSLRKSTFKLLKFERIK
jgi:hypothetical protein